MSNAQTDLVPANTALLPEGAQMPVARYGGDDAWNDVVTSASFLPRIMLIGGNSALAQEGKISPGRYAFVIDKNNFVDLGPQFDLIPLQFRFKAIRIPGDGNVFSYYDPKSAEFQKIKTDSETPDSGCMYGPEFVIWVPSQQRFATFFFSSKTARQKAPDLRSSMLKGQNATAKCELIKKGKNAWHGPIITICSTPMEQLPNREELLQVVTNFCNPKDSEVEKDEGQQPGEAAAQTDRPQ